MSYEQNYENLIKSLLNWGRYLKEANRTSDAIAVLEKAVSIGSDLSQNYILLSDLYRETQQIDKLLSLKNEVENRLKQNAMQKKVLQYIDNILNM
jgi:tetratricopeptide (TPR) repeat protein